MTPQTSILPKWTRELQWFLSVKPQFLFWGNIFDVYPLASNDSIITLRLTDYLTRILKDEGYSNVLSYEPLTGFQTLLGEPDIIEKVIGERIEPKKPLPSSVDHASKLIDRAVTNRTASTAIILSFASRLPEVGKQSIEEFNYLMFKLCQNAEPRLFPGSSYPKYNVVIWLLDKENDIPDWFTLDNPKIKVIPIPKPDYVTRKVVIEALSVVIDGFSDLNPDKREENISIFIDQTNTLHANEIVSIVSLAKRASLPFSEIAEAIRRYKLGIIENPWSKLDLKKIEQAEEIIGKRVKGQKIATGKAVDVIKRSTYNLSGAQYSKHSSRPKGVLFFAGPTGVGKTELAKAITELIFGSETSYIRFDMTEFKQDHADQRLIGSPPGYLGYDVGGELTNAIKQNPFSVILFDEIEKANSKILDLFMQMIDDGRLTSGRGETVYFSESIIIFTSNLGMYEKTPDGREIQRINPGMEYDVIEENMMESIKHFFTYSIARPEILNRIGENIVVFDFIRPDVAREIFDKMLDNVLEKVLSDHQITITIQDAVKDQLLEICMNNLTMGGRGIGNQMEESFINPLSRALFAEKIQQKSVVSIEGINENGGVSEIILSVKSPKV